MNRFHFTEYVKNPVTLGDSTIPELKTIVETYPWFQTAQLLYAKALSNSNHVDYYSSLKKTSIVAADRQMLYKLITQAVPSEKPTLFKPEEKKTEKQENKTVVAKTEQIELSVETEIALPEIKLTSNTVNHISSPDIVLGNEEFITSEQQEEAKSKQEEEKIKRVELIVTPKEEIQQVKKAEEQIHKSLPEEKKELKIAPLQEAEEKNLDEVIVNPVVNAYIEKEFFHVTDIHKPAAKKEESVYAENVTETQKGKEVFTATLNEPHSFTEWLKLISQQKQQSQNQHPSEQKELTTAEVKENKKEETVPPVQLDEKRMKKLEIMDKIIQNNPGPTRITETTQFFSATKTAKASSAEDETLVTETLAWIYEQQGNYPKAIRAYKTLSLKYPEKSVYFASLIQKIKLKQKQK